MSTYTKKKKKKRWESWAQNNKHEYKLIHHNIIIRLKKVSMVSIPVMTFYSTNFNYFLFILLSSYINIS